MNLPGAETVTLYSGFLYSATSKLPLDCSAVDFGRDAVAAEWRFFGDFDFAVESAARRQRQFFGEDAGAVWIFDGDVDSVAR